MRNTRVVAIVVGLLLLLPGLGLLVGGGSLGLVNAFGRDDSGYVTQPVLPVRSSSAVVTTDDLAVVLDPQVPQWVVDTFETSVRLRVTSTDPNRAIFVGAAATSDLDRYVSGVGHEVMSSSGASPAYSSVPGTPQISPPAGHGFWIASAQGTGTRELTWQPSSGHWSLAVANADGLPGVSAQVTLAVRVGSLLPLALLLLAAGVLLTLGGALLVRHGVKEPTKHLGATPPPSTPVLSGGNASQWTSAGTSGSGRNPS